MSISPQNYLNICSLEFIDLHYKHPCNWGRNYVTWSIPVLKHKEIVGAHPGRGKCPIWELLFQGIQPGGSLVFPRKIVGSNGHGDHSFRLFFQHLYFYPELPCRGLESMRVKYKVVPSFTCDRGAVAKRPLRKCWPFVGSNIEWHMAWSCCLKGQLYRIPGCLFFGYKSEMSRISWRNFWGRKIPVFPDEKVYWKIPREAAEGCILLTVSSDRIVDLRNVRCYVRYSGIIKPIDPYSRVPFNYISIQVMKCSSHMLKKHPLWLRTGRIRAVREKSPTADEEECDRTYQS